MSFLNKIFKNPEEKYFKKLQPIIVKINSFESEFEKFSEQQLKDKTFEFKARLNAKESLEVILPEAFALVREAAKRTLKQRHFDVQLICGIILHEGKISEMKTGEGKTLSATLPLYLNALEGKGAHLVTVNDYLARRDTVWMGQIYNILGVSVGCINHEQSFLYDANYKKPTEEKDNLRDILGSFKIVEDYLKPVTRKEAYQADITYGTNNEFGFDYLRNNMVYDLKNEIQRSFHYAIIDEVDSILIDEARTPLIISAPEEESTEKYYRFAKVVAQLKESQDYEIDEKMKAAIFTIAGQDKIVKILGYDPWAENNIATTHQLEAALKAKSLFKKDKDYIVKDNQIIIVDEFTGRLMPGRRWSGGIHQAVEAKEGIEVQKESRTLASITFQNYFRMYRKLAGMTGTATTSAEEFDKVYGLEVKVVPTNKPLIRKQLSDRIYKTLQGKFEALAKEIKEMNAQGRPVLVGTTSIEKNEYLEKLLSREGVEHKILNAKNHQKEGEIIAQAGKIGAVTIATNMAGRGVDIILGGNPLNEEEQKRVIELGGLHIIGTERHEARRIDNQLRGRAGRQGDPGSSQFFISLEDDLVRVFGGERIKSLMDTLKIPEDQPIEAKIISKAIESAQTKIEGMNFDLRKHVLEYDDVMNKHREVFYRKRREILNQADYVEEKSNKAEETETGQMQKTLRSYIVEIIKKAGYSESDYQEKEKQVGEENMRQVEKIVCLRVLDSFWVEHLEDMERLRDSVRLRAYGQQDPLVEYKREGHKMFQELLKSVENTIANAVFKAEIKFNPPENQNLNEKRERPQKPMSIYRDQNTKEEGTNANNPLINKYKKVGRNDLCPCGSGKKYKKCCWPKYG
jgi:preprotein translocase subunit SecA